MFYISLKRMAITGAAGGEGCLSGGTQSVYINTSQIYSRVVVVIAFISRLISVVLFSLCIALVRLGAHCVCKLCIYILSRQQ
jgi:hypothetical protein